MSELQNAVETIFANLDAAEQRLKEIDDALDFLYSQGMYPCEASEQWQSRPNGQSEYLYMIFPSDGQGGHRGPQGKRKLYVGADPERIAEARQSNANRRLYDRLIRGQRDLQYWISGTRQTFYGTMAKLKGMVKETAAPPGVPELRDLPVQKLPTL